MFVFYLIELLLIPLTMLGFGVSWKKHPPKTINGAYGYRTSMSMKNQETWNYAHKLASKYWLYLGLPVGIISLIILFVFRSSNENTLGIAVVTTLCIQVVGLISPIPLIEAELRKYFNKDGSRKH